LADVTFIASGCYLSKIKKQRNRERQRDIQNTGKRKEMRDLENGNIAEKEKDKLRENAVCQGKDIS